MQCSNDYEHVFCFLIEIQRDQAWNLIVGNVSRTLGTPLKKILRSPYSCFNAIKEKKLCYTCRGYPALPKGERVDTQRAQGMGDIPGAARLSELFQAVCRTLKSSWSYWPHGGYLLPVGQQ